MLRTSSILSWLWGILLLLMGASIAYPFIIQNQYPAGLIFYLSVMLFVSLSMCLAGYGIWKKKKPYNSIAITSVIILLTYSITYQTKISLVSIALGIFILGSIIYKQKEFV